MDFTSWDRGLRPDELAHHGIPGMKWGVRRFQNADGSLTPKGEKRYGMRSVSRSSAGSMTRHLNKLDKGYANVTARQSVNAYNTSKFMRKSKRAEYKGNAKKAEKFKNKAMKSAQKASENNAQRKAIENLQWKIIAKAARQGYTTNSTAVKRSATDGKTKVAAFLGGGLGVSAYTASKRGRNAVKIDAQDFKVTRRGSGKSNVINYGATRKQNVQQAIREEEYRKKYGNVSRR